MDEKREIRILCIEDNEDDFEIIKRSLHKTIGEAVILERAPTAKEGLSKLREGDYHLIILDYNLPDMNGVSMMKAMRSEGLTIPIILLTGQGDEKVAVDAMKQGAADYITKSELTTETLGNAIMHIVAMFEFLRGRIPSLKELGKRRSTVSILACVLHNAIHGIGKTQMVYQANLNSNTIKKYLGFLLTKGFLSVHTMDGKEFFTTTQTGLKLLAQLQEIEENFD
jgi:CheY-like chemotaxis protein